MVTMSILTRRITWLTKIGTGFMFFHNGGNNYDGQTVINAGGLTVTADHALGSTNGGTTVNSGGTLGILNVNYTTTEALQLNGTGGVFAGALESQGTDVFAGAVTLGSNASIVLLRAGSLT